MQCYLAKALLHLYGSYTSVGGGAQDPPALIMSGQTAQYSMILICFNPISLNCHCFTKTDQEKPSKISPIDLGRLCTM